MKKIVFFLLLAVSAKLSAQTTAQNWTKTDCNGVSHTLFSYLDSNKVVVMEFGMGCSSCIVAGQNLTTMKNTYASSNPGDVHFFYLDYTSNSCTTINNSLANNAIDFPGINAAATQKNYYTTGSPMPMVVVVGGPSHKVYYKKTSYSTGDNTAIQNAINLALSEMSVTGIADNTKPSLFSAYPNPAKNEVTITYHLEKTSDVTLRIFDFAGKEVYAASTKNVGSGNQNVLVPTSELAAGLYYVSINTETSKQTLKLEIVK